MCSLTGEGDIEELGHSVRIKTLHEAKILHPKTCNKCVEKPCVILRSKDVYCKSCFLSSTLHKFKALLGKHKLIKNDDRVLIYYKGGHPSTALHHFLQSGLDLPTPKKLRFLPIYLFVVDQHSLSTEENIENLRKIQYDFENLSTPVYFTSLLNYRDGSLEEIYLTNNFDDLCNKTDIYNQTNIFNGTSLANDYMEIHIRKLLIGAAKKLDCQFVFTPELSKDIASNILSNVVLGRGAHIPLDSGFCDDRDEKVKILRPLRAFDIKEIALYNYYNHLNPIIIHNSPKEHNMSVQAVIEKFVNDLQSNYVATVNTVLKTGDKLSMVSKLENLKICNMCKGPLDVSSQILTTREAIQFSHEISTQSEQFRVHPTKKDSQQLSETTCFSCSNIAYLIIPKK